MKKIVKKIIPSDFLLYYHYVIALIATIFYRFPSKKMVVIGVTGTKGKTSAINFIWACLSAGGYKTGIISTANIRIGEKEFLNKYHMTMPGRFTIQKLMAQMVKEGCTHCIVETTSEGVRQHRHVGVYYDIAVFTNLSPEHLESHGGSFEKYREMKGKMFEALSVHSRRKTIAGKQIDKVSVINRDDRNSSYFINFDADKKITFGQSSTADLIASNIKETPTGVNFSIENIDFKIGIIGKFNVYNALPAIAIAKLFNISDPAIKQGLLNLRTIPGRMEKIEEGQKFTVIVDYAHEKESMTHALMTAKNMKEPGAKSIILLGAEGGGRDKAKRPIMGELAAKFADYVIVSNVDPYDDDPKVILEDIATTAEKFGKVRGTNLFVIEDRRAGIRKSLSLAKPGDFVMITGKGAEQSMVVGGTKIPWDDREVVREELRNML